MGRRRGGRKNARQRPVVELGPRPLRDVTKDLLETLQRTHRQRELFAREGRLVRLLTDEHGRPRIDTLTVPTLRHELCQAVDFFKPAKDGTEAATPTDRNIQDVLASRSWPVPNLLGICELPIVRPDGSLVGQRGHDRNSGLYYWPSPELGQLHVPESPSEADLSAARAALEDLLGDFPFDGETSKTNALALLLTPLLRPVIEGPVPLALIGAPDAGTGKTLLARVVTVISCGRDDALASAPGSESEWRKQITTWLQAGSSLVVLDNLEQELRAAALAAVLTATTWTDRYLGGNEQARLPNRTTWVATGNNVRIRGDLGRRCYPVRLDSQQAQPWRRTGFKHDNLIAWAKANRCALVRALLLLVRSWCVAGRPAPSVRPLGSFEDWTHIVGGVLEHAGYASFLGNLESFHESADDDQAEFEALLARLHGHFGEDSFTAADVLSAARADRAFAELVPQLANERGREQSGSARSLGILLARLANRRFGPEGLHLADGGKDGRNRTRRWSVRKSRSCGSSEPRGEAAVAAPPSGRPELPQDFDSRGGLDHGQQAV